MDSKAILEMRNNATVLENEGKYWDDETIDRLVDMYYGGIGISEIAFDLKRGENAIVQQLGKQKCFFNVQKQRQRIKSNCKCRCFECTQFELCKFSPKHRDTVNL